MITHQKVLFQNPLIIGRLENIDNNIIIKNALDNKDNKLSNDTSQSHHEDSFLPMSDELQKIFDNINIDLKNKMHIELELKNYWSIVGDHNNSVHILSHSDCDIAIVYYPQVYENSGDIIFQWVDDISSSWNKNKYKLTPENNMYIAFPGYLQHYVTKNQNKNTRISVSANFDIKKT